MSKRVCLLFLTVVFIISFSASVHAMSGPDLGISRKPSYYEKARFSLIPSESSSPELSEAFVSRPVDTRQNGIAIKGSLPLVTGYHNIDLQDELNKRFDNLFSAIAGNASASAKSLTFSFDTKEFGDYFSFIIYASEQSSFSNHWVRTVNIDKQEQKILTVNSVFGPNGVKIANKFLEKRISLEDGKYSSSFKGIDDNCAFYMTDEEMVLLFDKYAIAAGSYDIVEIIMPVECVKNVVVRKGSDYYTKSAYNLKMVKLTKVAYAFGYSLTWTQSTETIEVMYQNTIVSSIQIGINKYPKGKLSARALEMPPELVGDRTYVPLSFFEEILDLSYSVTMDGDIVFSSYIEPSE